MFEEKIKHVYREADKEIRKISTICRKGCSYCCYQPVQIVDCEKLVIEKYIEKDMPGKVRRNVQQNLRSWLSHFKAYSRPYFENAPLKEDEVQNTIKQMASVQTACPFLVDSFCSIYKVRPMSCRLHIVRDDLSQCKENPSRDACHDSMTIQKHLFSKLCKIGPYFSIEWLPIMLLRTFDLAPILIKKKLWKRTHSKAVEDQLSGCFGRKW